MPKVISHISRVAAAARAAGGETVKEAADTHVSVSRQAAPVDKGVLRDGIHAEKKGELEWEAQSSAPYSAYVEFNQPYFLPGYEAAKQQVKEHARPVFARHLAQVGIR